MSEPDNLTPAQKARRAAEIRAAEKKAKRKRLYYIMGGVGTFFILFIWWGFQPLKGPIEVGICRTYAEMELDYPHTFKIMTYEPFERSTRLYYTLSGAFGEYRSQMIDCKFLPRQSGQVPQLESVTIRRVPEPAAKVAEFNATIPVIIKNKPNRTIPFPYDGTLMDLKRD